MVVPPKTMTESHAKVLSRETVGHRLAGDSECSGGEDSRSCKEDDLCLSGIEDEATGRAPCHKTIDGKLHLVKEDRGVRAAAKDRAVVGKGNTEGGAVI